MFYCIQCGKFHESECKSKNVGDNSITILPPQIKIEPINSLKTITNQSKLEEENRRRYEEYRKGGEIAHSQYRSNREY
jgi:hypothetical protein